MSDAGRIEVTVQIDILGLDQFDKVAAAAQRMAAGVDDSTNKMVQNVGRFERLRQALDDLEQKYDGVFRAGFRLQAAGRDLAAVGDEILDSLVGVTEGYADYDLMLRRAGTALNTNAEWQKNLDLAIQDTAISIGLFSPEEVAEAYYIWGAAAGVVVDSQEELADITAVVQDVMVATAMAGGNLESNLNGVFAVMSQFDLPAERATDVTQALALMTERTASTFADLTSAFTYIGPFADEMGVKFEDITSMLGLLSDNGIKGSRAGRGLSMMLEGLSAPSGPAKKALDSVAEAAFGVGATFDDIVFDKNGEFKGMRAFVMDMAKGMKNLTTEEKAYVFAKGFTNNATRAFIPLIKDQIKLLEQGADAHGEFASALDTEKYSLDGAAEFFEKMRESALGSIHAIVGSVRNSFFPILQMIAVETMRSVQPVLDMVKAWTEAFTEWLRANPAIVSVAVHLASLVGVALVAAGTFLMVVGSVILFATGIFFAIQALGLIIAIFGPIIAGFTAIAAAVTFVVQDVVRNWEQWEASLLKLRMAFNKFLEELDLGTAGFGQAWGTIGDIVSDALGSMLDSIHRGIDLLTKGLTALAANEDAMNFIRNLVTWIAKLAAIGTSISVAGFSLRTMAGAAVVLGGTAVMVSKFVYAVSGLKSLVSVIKAVNSAFLFLAANPIVLVIIAIVAAIAALVWAFQNNFMGVRDIALSVWAQVQVIFENAVNIIGGVIDAIGGIFNDVSTVVQGVARPFIETFGQYIPRAIAAVQRKFEQWGEKIGEIVDTVRPFIEHMAAFITDIFINRVLPRIQEFITFLSENLGPVWESIADIVVIVAGIIGTVLGTIIDGFFVFAQAVADALNTLTPVFEFLVEYVVIVFERIMSVIQGFIEIVMGIINAFAAILTGDWGKLWDALGQIVSGFFTIMDGIFKFGVDLIRSVIANGLELIFNLFTTIIGAIIDFLWQVPGWLWDIGNTLMSFFWQGILSLVQWVLGNFFGFITSVVQFFIDLPGKLFNEAKKLLPKMWDGFIALNGMILRNITNFIGDFVDWFADLPGKMLELGKDIVRGIWDGIKNLAGWIMDKVTAFMGDIWDNVITFWDNHSPSRRMAGLGEQLMQGLAIGIVGAGGDANAEMMNTMRSISATAEKHALNTNLAFSGQQDYSYASAERKVLEVKVDVTSSDGTVDDKNAQTIGDAIHKGLMLDRLDHMVTVR